MGFGTRGGGGGSGLGRSPAGVPDRPGRTPLGPLKAPGGIPGRPLKRPGGIPGHALKTPSRVPLVPVEGPVGWCLQGHGRVARLPAGQLRQAVPQFRAPRGGAGVVVPGPGEVEAQGVGLLGGGRGGQQAGQRGLAFDGVALLAEHDVEAVGQGVPRAGPGVVRRERGPVQGAGALKLGRRGGGAVLRGEVRQQRLHDVPRRHLAPVQAGPHAVGVAPPEDPAPATALLHARQQAVQVARELPLPTGESIHRHRSAPARPPALPSGRQHQSCYGTATQSFPAVRGRLIAGRGPLRGAVTSHGRERAPRDQLVHRQPEDLGERGHGEERGRRRPARLDLAERLGGDARPRGDLGHAPAAARLAQQLPEPLAAFTLFGGEGGAHHAPILIPPTSAFPI